MENKVTIRCECEKKNIETRIKRITGQLNGVKKMVEGDRYCEDVLIQLSAIKEAVNSLSIYILNNHLNSCIKKHVDDEETLDEIVRLFKAFNK